MPVVHFTHSLTRFTIPQKNLEKRLKFPSQKMENFPANETSPCVPFYSPLCTIFLADSDPVLIQRMVILGWFGILFALLWNIFCPVRYGKISAEEKEEAQGRTEIIFFLDKIKIPSRITWIVGFLPTQIIPLLTVLFTPAPFLQSPGNLIALLVYWLHYFQRTFIYPCTISEKAKPNPLWFLVGVLILDSFNSILQAHHLLNVAGEIEVGAWVYLGLILSVVGFLTNLIHDRILTRLRAEGKGYQVPFGGLFPWVSSPNYLGEIVEWWGLFIITRSLPQLLLAVWTTVFLGFRAKWGHAWYLQKFPDYPKQRKALLPFIF